jgi:hypothetical protein
MPRTHRRRHGRGSGKRDRLDRRIEYGNQWEKASMIPPFKRFDRVRVRRAVHGYQIGDKGTVLQGPGRYAGPDGNSYVVSMDKDGPGTTTTVFKEEEIEVDE